MMSKPISKDQTMTSREIASIVRKEHKDVMRAIRNMEPAWEKINGRKFALVEYKDKKGEMRPMYKLNAYETLFIATKFNDEARAKLVLRWAELETKEKARKFAQPRKTRKGIERKPYSEQEINLIMWIKEHLIEGDYNKIAEETGYSKPNISLVLNGLHVNQQILEAAYGVAFFNNLRGFSKPSDTYNINLTLTPGTVLTPEKLNEIAAVLVKVEDKDIRLSIAKKLGLA